MKRGVMMLVLFVLAVSTARALPSALPETEPKPVPQVEHSLGHRLLWYLPNRFLDLVDIFRLRFRAGPGVAVQLRLTDYAAFYGGSYNSVYFGLPGPRSPKKWKWPAGFERNRGIVFFGIDATDDTDRGPGYSPTEFGFGFHLLILGVDAGVDPVEIGDFFGGFILFDPRHDDL